MSNKCICRVNLVIPQQKRRVKEMSDQEVKTVEAHPHISKQYYLTPTSMQRDDFFQHKSMSVPNVFFAIFMCLNVPSVIDPDQQAIS